MNSRTRPTELNRTVITERGDPGEAGDRSGRDERLRRLLAELEMLRETGLFTEEQFEDERRRLLEEAGGEPGKR